MDGGAEHQMDNTIAGCVRGFNLDMQKVLATRPLVAEILSDCGMKKAGIPLNLWKLSNQILRMITFCVSA
jgi:hypothetical protein